MLVSHTKKFIYIKTVKTAGTSTEVALQDYCLPPDNDYPTDNVPCEMSVTDQGIIGARGIDVTDKTWYHHMPAAKIRDQLPAEVWSGYTKICNIRNPWDKTVSWFHFIHGTAKSLPEAEMIAAFRDFVRPEDSAKPSIGADSHIYFIDGKPVGDEYIRYERLNEDYLRVCETLGIEPKPLPALKRESRGTQTVPYRKYYDAELRDLVAKIYEKEIAAFGWDF